VTEIYIEGIGERVVQDKPAGWIIKRYDGRILDLYFENHADAWNFGKQELEVFIQTNKKISGIKPQHHINLIVSPMQ